ncbi:MAG: rab guanine nucleotide exchange factor S2 [Phylliscum demangeonii]|nr:MAG: rab guanine nucleotide exchange factor S2 [Phylliscum demangeonii]
MAAVVAPAPVPGPAFHLAPDPSRDGALSHPQNPTSTPPLLERHSTPAFFYPDMNNEVTALSNKLINAINFQTNLDESLMIAQLELETSKERIRQLEARTHEHDELMGNGTLVKRIDVDAENVALRAALDEEKQLRAVVEKDKKGIEQELENLTTALFEEANQMVAAARHERDNSERKNDQLRAQLQDTEVLLASHQEQLAELKKVMQQMRSDQEEIESNQNVSTTPNSPTAAGHDRPSTAFDVPHVSPHTPMSDDVPPSYPTSFSHLLQPVLRTDLAGYQDFISLLHLPRHSPSRSRASTATYAGLSVVGLGSLAPSPSNSSEHSPSNGSSPAVSVGGAQGSTSVPPLTPGSAPTSAPAKDANPLKETRFYKKVLVEDIEPTLRLDTAPGLSWLARRSVISSMSEGNLVVEPLPTTPSLRVPSCALCGEKRRGDEHARTHQFKTTETGNAQRYPLCQYCTSRVRATCDFLGFLRMVKDGHWRAEGGEAEKCAWEESVKLRERMFWARIGGGVVPAFLKHSPRNSPRTSTVGEPRGARQGSGLGFTEEAAVAVERVKVKAKEDVDEDEAAAGRTSIEKDVETDVFHSNEKRASIGNTIISLDAPPQPASSANHHHPLPAESVAESVADPKAPASFTSGPPPVEHDAAAEERQLPDAVDETQTVEAPPPMFGHATARRERPISLTIPGAFE